MKAKQVLVIGLGAVLFFSFTLAAISISSPQETVTLEEFNAQVNGFVDSCMQTLPEGIPECDEQLRSIVTEVCEAQPSLDACTDGRVDEYYRARDMVT